jgi:hypothetical protein
VDKVLRFLGGMAISFVYVVLVSLIVSAVPILTGEWATVCFVAALVGWLAISVVAFHKEQPWVGYGIVAAPFIFALVFTIGCFAVISVSGAAAAG